MKEQFQNFQILSVSEDTGNTVVKKSLIGDALEGERALSRMPRPKIRFNGQIFIKHSKLWNRKAKTETLPFESDFDQTYRITQR